MAVIPNHPHSQRIENLPGTPGAQVHYYLSAQFSWSSLKIDPLTEDLILQFLMEKHLL